MKHICYIFCNIYENGKHSILEAVLFLGIDLISVKKKSLCMKVENVNSRIFRNKNPYIGEKWETIKEKSE